MRAWNTRESLVFILSVFASNYIRDEDRALPKTINKAQDIYDYIIVGAGSAGSTLAYRLSEGGSSTVLVLEAGGQPNLFTEIPAANAWLYKSPLDWNYVTVPQKHSCQSLEGKRSYWPRGKVLGGSSSINFNIYIRGNRRDYDLWESLGAEGWGWDKVFPYFLKAEGNRDMDDPRITAPGYHSSSGPLSVEKPSYESVIGKAFLEAGRQLGYNVSDPNGPRQTGFSRLQGTLRRGLRCSTAGAYLRPASLRDNVHILVRTLVTKVVFEGKQAVGVEYEREGKKWRVMARKEVILSGGSINTPQILMLSGIGPRTHLEKLKIPVVHASEGVGANLQDHISANGMIFYINTTGLSLTATQIYSEVSNFDELMSNGTGILTLLGNVEGAAFVDTRRPPSGDHDWPDIQFHFLPGSLSTFKREYQPLLALTDKVWDAFYGADEQRESFVLLPVLLRPRSRGTIRLASRDPRKHPLIDPRYLHDPEDVSTLAAGMRLALTIASSRAFEHLGTIPFDRPVPGCEGHELLSDPYLECHARAMTMTFYHPSGTCRMGNDSGSVLDPQLRVRGVQGLRVVDASVMPTVVSGNTNAPVTMIAERAADIIRGFEP